MPYFRKKPVVVEAVQWNGNNFDEVVELGGRIIRPEGYTWLDIGTLEGTMRADLGDWIIKGVKGEVYPCKPDIFAATYERVDDEKEF